MTHFCISQTVLHNLKIFFEIDPRLRPLHGESLGNIAKMKSKVKNIKIKVFYDHPGLRAENFSPNFFPQVMCNLWNQFTVCFYILLINLTMKTRV